MSSYPAPLARLIKELSRLPGIGEKTAARLAFHMLKEKAEDMQELAESIGRLKGELGLCRICFGLSEVDPRSEDGAQCGICRDLRREREKICVVEEPSDVMAVEKSQEYKGLYHVLHGTISPLDGVGPDALRIKELLERVGADGVREVIVATNPTVEGEATALYLSKALKPLGISVTRIARGLPMGGDLEYTDAVTLGKAFEGRREIQQYAQQKGSDSGYESWTYYYYLCSVVGPQRQKRLHIIFNRDGTVKDYSFSAS